MLLHALYFKIKTNKNNPQPQNNQKQKKKKIIVTNKFLQQMIGANIPRTIYFQIKFNNYNLACIQNLSDSVLVF